MSWAAVGILTGVQYMLVLVAVKQGHKYEMYPSEFRLILGIVSYFPKWNSAVICFIYS